MAIWETYEGADGNLGLNYRNLITGQAHACGVLRPDTPVVAVLAWILDKGDPNPFDWVTLPGGEVLLLLPELEVRQRRPAPRPDWRRRS